jgi:hypothetical protein
MKWLVLISFEVLQEIRALLSPYLSALKARRLNGSGSSTAKV